MQQDENGQRGKYKSTQQPRGLSPFSLSFGRSHKTQFSITSEVCALGGLGLNSSSPMHIHNLFFTSDCLLRSGWRIAVFILTLALFGFVAAIPTFAIISRFSQAIPPGGPVFLIIGSSGSVAAALAAGWVCGKYLENLPFRALGAAFSRGWLRHFLTGILFGAAAISLAVGIGTLFGKLSFGLNPVDGIPILKSMAISLGVFAAAAAFEESLFRGYVLQTLSRAGLAWLGVSLTSVFFLVVHLRNPESGTIAAVNTGLAGVWFGIAYLRTRDLWFVWGIHLIWNWMQGSVYGIEVSGLTGIASAPLLTELDGGPVWLTGGKYGLEGGIAATMAVLASIVAILYLPILKPDPDMLALSSSKRND